MMRRTINLLLMLLLVSEVTFANTVDFILLQCNSHQTDNNIV